MILFLMLILSSMKCTSTIPTSVERPFARVNWGVFLKHHFSYLIDYRSLPREFINKKINNNLKERINEQQNVDKNSVIISSVTSNILKYIIRFRTHLTKNGKTLKSYLKMDNSEYLNYCHKTQLRYIENSFESLPLKFERACLSIIRAGKMLFSHDEITNNSKRVILVIRKPIRIMDTNIKTIYTRDFHFCTSQVSTINIPADTAKLKCSNIQEGISLQRTIRNRNSGFKILSGSIIIYRVKSGNS
ncbi:hypothetical protein H8356DRAFT_1421260 [Neocallimastix lanati (nom. inval.)]|nr:hypothetical protein H8356DRAFT_1421260 [Neocallimastix sp. JGI-2020a]